MRFDAQWMRGCNSAIAQELMEYEKLEIAVKQLIGYDFKCLYELFKMGWTLEPPSNACDASARASLADIISKRYGAQKVPFFEERPIDLKGD